MIANPKPTRRTNSRTTRRFAGFTLVEMLVVIVLIGIVVGITVPMISATNRAGALDSGVNEVSAALTAARSIAMRDNTEAGVVFFRDGATDATLMRIVKRNSDITLGRIGFVDYDDRPPTVLPSFIRVTFPNMTTATAAIAAGVGDRDSWAMPGRFNYTHDTLTNPFNDSDLGTTVPPWNTWAVIDPVTFRSTNYYIIWFGPSGAIRTSHPSVSNPVSTHSTASSTSNCIYYDVAPAHNFFNFNANPKTDVPPPTTPVSVVPSGTPSAPDNTYPEDAVLVPAPYLAIFDLRDAIDACQTANPTSSQLGLWINARNAADSSNITTKARLFMFNRYTGQIVKCQ